MEITVRAMPRALFVRLDGELDLHTAPEFKARVKAAFERAPHLTTLIVVLTDVRFIDSPDWAHCSPSTGSCRNGPDASYWSTCALPCLES